MKFFYLHGMGGSPSDWDLVREHHPGEALALLAPATFEQAAEALALRWKACQEPFVAVGYSLGGRLALRASELGHQPYCKGLVLLGVGLGFVDEKGRLERSARDSQWAALAEKDPSRFWKEWYEQELFSSFLGLPESLRARWMKSRLSLDINHLRSQLVEQSPASHGDLLPALLSLSQKAISVLYIAGERDKKYRKLAKELAQQGIPAKTIPGGHVLPWESPSALAEALRVFVNPLEQGN